MRHFQSTASRDTLGTRTSHADRSEPHRVVRVAHIQAREHAPVDCITTFGCGSRRPTVATRPAVVRRFEFDRLDPLRGGSQRIAAAAPSTWCPHDSTAPRR